MLRALLALLAALALAHPAAARWIVAETPHFRIHSDGGERAVRERAATLEDFHRLLELLTGREVPDDAPKLNIYEIGSREQVRWIAPDMRPDVSGFYRATPGGILAVVRRGGSAEWNEDVLLHEYAHHFMFQVGAAALPAWYVEGFAEYMMTAQFRPDRIEYAQVHPVRAGWLANAKWLSPQQLLGGSCATLNREACAMFYAQAWLLTHRMFRDEPMRPKLKDYLNRVSRGEQSMAAWKAAVGDPSNLNNELMAYTRSPRFTLTRVGRKPRSAADVKITALPPGADGTLIPLVSLALPQKAETDAANLRRVRTAAAAAPTDPFAARALAIAEVIAGDRTAGAAKLDALLAAAPSDTELLFWRAHAHRPATGEPSPADLSAMRRLLARAFRAEPNNWRVLYAYADSFPPGAAPDTLPDVWARAVTLAPQVAPLGVGAGIALARAGRLEEAYAALAPVVNNPHSAAPPPMRALAEALRANDPARTNAALAALQR